MNKIHKRALKRKRILEGRIECHGNKFNCVGEHIERRRAPVYIPPTVRKFESTEKFFNPSPKKPGFFKRLFNRKVA